MDFSVVTGSTQENYFSRIYEIQRAALMGSWEVDLTNQSIVWSDVVREIFEVGTDFLPETDIILEFFDKTIHKESVMDAFREIISEGVVRDVEVQITTAKQNERWIRITAQAEMQDGVCVHLYGALHDITDKKMAEQALLESHNRYESLLQTVDGIVWEANADTFEFSFVSDQVERILGYTAKEWMSSPYFWQEHIHPDDRDQAIHFCHWHTNARKNHLFDYRMIAADSRIVWIKDIVSVIVSPGSPTILRGVMVDITETKRFEMQENLEKSVLELNHHNSFEKILDEYLLGIEELYPQMKCSIMGVVDNRLHNWSSPGISKEYLAYVEDLAIGECVGSCGTAAFRKERVVVSDIENDPIWAAYSHIPLQFGLRACWSHPIFDSENNVVATFAIYYDHVREPDEDELKVIDRAVAILKLIFENKKNAELIDMSRMRLRKYVDALKKSNERYEFLNKATNDAIYDWDILHDHTEWGDGFRRLFGFYYDNKEFQLKDRVDKLHPADRKKIHEALMHALSDKTQNQFLASYMFLKADGKYAYVIENGYIMRDQDGQAVRMIGALRDVTKQKQEEQKLQEIAFMQSHVLRAPLSRVMGLVDLIRNYSHSDDEKQELLDHLMLSARQLDEVIRHISQKTV